MFHGRVFIDDKPTHMPNQCGYCGVSYDREWYMDTGLSFEYEGHLYICNKCIDQFRKLAGWYTTEEVDTIRSNYEEQIAEFKAAQDKLNKVSAFLDSLNLEVCLSGVGENFGPDPEPTTGIEQSPVVSEQEPDASELGFDSGEQDPPREVASVPSKSVVFDFD